MTFGGTPFGESTFAGTALIPVSAPPPLPDIIMYPVPTVFTMEIGGVQYFAMNNSLSIDVELGRQGTASFDLVNPSEFPRVGQPVRILFYSAILFVGAIDRISVRSDLSHNVVIASCECTDNSYLLFRRMVKRTFTNATLITIALALIADELVDDGISLGLIDNYPPLPLVDADNVSVYDLLRDAAASVGALFFIDHLKRLQFRSSTIPPAPMPIDETMAEDCTLTVDRETYRNRQTVIVTGTPASQNEQIQTVTYTTQNANQIPEQAVLEQTSGIYNSIESITHPTANTAIALMRLAVAYAKILLGLRGAIRQTLTIRTRQYGFLVGQTAVIDLPHLGMSGSWIVQRVSSRDESGRWLSTTIELSPSTLLRRAQELWIDIVRKGKVTVLPPTAITTQTNTYNTPGTFSFTVPAGSIVVQMTCVGAGGGGGGGAYNEALFYGSRRAFGAAGGRGGQAITVLDVTPGDVLTITVPNGGVAGVTQRIVNALGPAIGTNGSPGGTARVTRGVNFEVCAAYGGAGGIGGQANIATGLEATFPKAPDGSGLGQSTTTGGGSPGGIGGDGYVGTNGQAGSNGRVVLEW